jgi:putative tricarboxylic transport membrane protein
VQNLIHGLGALGNGPSLAYLFGGALIGMIVGMIPGLNTVVILSIILVFVYHIDTTGTLCLFLGAQCGSFYSASVSAILLNTPGHPEAFPITFDGYPMARKGQPARALGLSACSTCIGGFIGCAVLVGFLQIINDFPTLFHPPEYLALITIAMLMVGTLGTDSVAKAIVSAGAGLVLASIGPATITGTFRYTFGSNGLSGGISLVAVALGVFAIPQMVMVFGTGTATARQDMTGQEIGDVEAAEISHGYGRELTRGIIETFRHWGVLLQSGIIGALTGIIPGIGGFTGNFMSYGIAKQLSRKRDLYGTGIPDGIIAPEGSSLAKEAGHIIPILGLGIPGGVAGALFIGALSIKGIRTGYGFQQAYPNVTGEIVWIIALSGLIGTLAGVLIGPQIAKVTRLPGPLIAPFIFALCICGPFLTDFQFFAVIEVLVFGIIGLVLRRLRYPLGSFILGLVLGPTFESNIYLTHNIYPGFSFIGRRPVADVIFLLAIALLVSKSLELHRESTRTKTRLAKELAHIDSEEVRAEVIREQHRKRAPYPVLALVVSVLLLTVSLYVIFYGIGHYNFATVVMPFIGGLLIAIPIATLLPRDIYRFVLHRQSIRQERSRSQHETPDPPLFAQPSGAAHFEDAKFARSSDELNPGIVEAVEALDSALAASPDGSATIRERSWARHGQYRREVIAFGWLFGLVGLCWLVGFPIGTAIFMGGYGLTATRRYLRKIHHRVLFTIFSGAIMWLIVYEMFSLTHILFSPKISL